MIFGKHLDIVKNAQITRFSRIVDQNQKSILKEGFIGEENQVRLASYKLVGDQKRYINLKIKGREDSGNLLQKWSSICLNIDYENSLVQSWINGEDLGSDNRTLIYPNTNSMTVRLGKYFIDDTALIGKILDFNMWNRLLSQEEMEKFSQCSPNYSKIETAGNIINPLTQWEISGSLIEKIDVPEADVVCQNRTVLIPIRYEKMEEAMKICEILGKKGDYLKPFKTLQDYVELYNKFKNDPTMLKYCDHGGRHFMWLPYSGWRSDDGDPINITYYKSSDQLDMHEAWRLGHGLEKSHHQNDYCIIARMGNI